jgi:hypothetical protein
MHFAKPFKFRLILLSLFVLWTGCAPITEVRPQWSELTHPPREQLAVPHSPNRQVSHRFKPHAREIANLPQLGNPRASLQQQSASQVQGVELTLGGEGQDKVRASQLLQSTDLKLKALRDHSAVTANSSAYQQADSLAIRAHQVLDTGDYLAASKLAEKANTLARAIAEPQ